MLTTYRKRPPVQMSTKTLAALGDIDKDLAQKEGIGYADVHGDDDVSKSQTKYGDNTPSPAPMVFTPDPTVTSSWPTHS